MARRRAIDLVRRDAARRRCETVYATAPRESDQWADVSPLVDAALAEMDADSRNILLQHYLAGRTTVALAVEEGVSQATISRRIGKALEGLRERLRKMGVLAAVPVLSSMMHQGRASLPAGVAKELGKMAMTASAGATGAALVGWKIKVAVAGLLLAAAGGVFTHTREKPTAVGGGEPGAVVAAQGSVPGEGSDSAAVDDSIQPGVADTPEVDERMIVAGAVFGPFPPPMGGMMNGDGPRIRGGLMGGATAMPTEISRGDGGRTGGMSEWPMGTGTIMRMDTLDPAFGRRGGIIGVPAAISAAAGASDGVPAQRAGAVPSVAAERAAEDAERAVFPVAMGNVGPAASGAGFGSLARPAAAPATAPAGQRVLHFPKDRAAGVVFVEQSTRGSEYYFQRGNWDGYTWQCLGEARGDIIIPAGKKVKLEIDPPALFQTLAGLGRLAPDDIYHLKLRLNSDGKKEMPNGFDPQALLATAAGLRGLKVLDLGEMPITAAGLRSLRNFTQLERLIPPDEMTNEGLSIVWELGSLKGFYPRQVKAASTAWAGLARLKNLEELFCEGSGVDDGVMTRVAECPKLKLLFLNDCKVTSRGMAALSRSRSLKSLDLGGWQLDDAGLANLAKSPCLEKIWAYWSENITDAGVAAVKSMVALKDIDLSQSDKLTSRAATALGQLKSLECVTLDGMHMDDQALVDLARLPRLKTLSLHLPLGGPGVPNGQFSQKGLAALAAAGTPLEALEIGGDHIDDAALVQLSKVKSLTSLRFLPLKSVTNDGLAHLQTLPSLASLSVVNYSDTLTFRALKQMPPAGQLKSLNVRGVNQDLSGLDLSAFPNLENLSITMTDGQSLVDGDLAGVAKLKHLAGLSLGTKNDALTDAGLAHLAGQTSLTGFLSVGSLQFTDKAMASLAGMQNLTYLYFRGNIADEGLSQVVRLRGLQFAMVTTPKTCSPQAISAVKSSLPALHMIKVVAETPAK